MTDVGDRLDAARERLRERGAVDRRPFFTPRTLADYLAVSQRTVRTLLSDGSLPSVKIAGCRRILAEDVDEFVARNRQRRA